MQCDATVVSVMNPRRKRVRRKSGQALIEYAFLMVLLATIGVAVIIMAGNQLEGLFNDVSYEFNHLTDTVITGNPTCPNGTPAQLLGHQWHCTGDQNK